LQALRTVQKACAPFEAIEPTGKFFLYTCTESAARPAVKRYSQKLQNIELAGKVLITTSEKKTQHLESEFDTTLLMKAPFGPYPKQLAETYPIGQSEVPHPDWVSVKSALRTLIDFIRSKNIEATFAYDKKWLHDDLAGLSSFATLVPL